MPSIGSSGLEEPWPFANIANKAINNEIVKEYSGYKQGLKHGTSPDTTIMIKGGPNINLRKRIIGVYML